MRRLRTDAGSTTIWLLGLCVVVLALGGVSIDLWRAFSDRRALAGLADAAAAAGAAGIDEAHLRATGEVRLDPATSAGIARSVLARRPPVNLGDVVILPEPGRITVRLDATVELGLLRLLGGLGRLPISVTASAQPQRAP